jgi:hypothetical protein
MASFAKPESKEDRTSSVKEGFQQRKQAHEQTFEKDFQRCEVTMLDQSLKNLNTHLLANAVVLWKSCEKRIREPSSDNGAEF